VTLDEFVALIYVPHRARSISHVIRRRQWKYWTAQDAVQDAALEVVEVPELIAEYPADGGDDRDRHGTPSWWLTRVYNAGHRVRYHRDQTTELNLGFRDMRQFNNFRQEYGKHRGRSLHLEPGVDPLNLDALIGPLEAAAVDRRRAATEQWSRVVRGTANPVLAKPPRKPYTRRTSLPART
jgi:hypothetical protein